LKDISERFGVVMSLLDYDRTYKLSSNAELLFEKVMELFENRKLNMFSEHYPLQEQDKEVCYLWPLSAVYSAVIALMELNAPTGKYAGYLKKLDSMLEYYWDTRRQPPAYQALPSAYGGSERFYDDNEWLGLDFVRAYRLTQNEKYLKGASVVYKFILSGCSNELGGGIYWCEQKKDMKNTCSNGPGALLCLELYKTTKETAYLEKGLELYLWTKSKIQAPDGLYLDHIKIDGTTDNTKYAYNSGTMLHSAVELFLITKEYAYLEEAQRIADASLNFFAPLRSNGKRFYHAETPWFTAVLFRAFKALYEVDGNDIYVCSIIENLEYAWEHARDMSGLIENDWSGETISASKWLLDQAAMVELYARAALITEINMRR